MRNQSTITTITALLAIAAAVWALWPTEQAPEPAHGSGANATTPSSPTPAKADGAAKPLAKDATKRVAATDTDVAAKQLTGSLWQLTGSVTNPDGTAAADVQVRAFAETFYFGRWELPVTKTKVDGSYFIDLEPWRTRPSDQRHPAYLMVRAFAPTVAGSNPSKFPADADPEKPLALEADIKLELLATVTGRVLDVTGRPVANAQVTLMPGTKPSDMIPGDDRTDAEGRYRFRSGMEGQHTVRATRADLGVASRLFDIEEDTHTELPDLVLKPTSELRGVVVYSDGQPVANAPMMLSKHGPFTTDATGRFLFRNLQPGEYRVTPNGNPKDGGIVQTGKGFQTVTVSSARLTLHFRTTGGERMPRQDVTAYALPEPFGADLAQARTYTSLPTNVRAAASSHFERGQDLFAPHGTWFWVETPLRARRPALCVVQLRHGSNETIGELVFAEPQLDAQIHVTAQRDDGTTVTDLFVSLEPLVRAPRIPYVEVPDIKNGKKLRAPAGTYLLRVWEGWRSQYPSTFPHEETIQLSPGNDIKKVATLARGGLVELLVNSHGTAPGTKLNVEASGGRNGQAVDLAPFRIRDPGSQREREHSQLRAGRPAKSKVLLPLGRNTVQIRLGDDVWSKTIEIRAGTHQRLQFDLDR